MVIVRLAPLRYAASPWRSGPRARWRHCLAAWLVYVLLPVDWATSSARRLSIARRRAPIAKITEMLILEAPWLIISPLKRSSPIVKQRRAGSGTGTSRSIADCLDCPPYRMLLLWKNLSALTIFWRERPSIPNRLVQHALIAHPQRIISSNLVTSFPWWTSFLLSAQQEKVPILQQFQQGHRADSHCFLGVQATP
jgi:hypothetical protein